ncbi:hypothetical protein ACJX0J_038247, partial [Zea mays]
LGNSQYSYNIWLVQKLIELLLSIILVKNKSLALHELFCDSFILNVTYMLEPIDEHVIKNLSLLCIVGLIVYIISSQTMNTHMIGSQEIIVPSSQRIYGASDKGFRVTEEYGEYAS